MGENIELGPGREFELIRRIRERLGQGSDEEVGSAPAGSARRAIAVAIGDDAAVTVPRGATATSVDALVEGVHFDPSYTPRPAIGHKALATALSDLAAMGASPGEAYVMLGAPESYEPDAILEVCDGIAALARSTGTGMLGGDLTRAPALFLAATVVGHAATPADLVRRAGATQGSTVVATGELGGAAAGRLLLRSPELGDALSRDDAEGLRERQLRPLPRLAAGIALARTGAEAMIDISDGLGSDAAHLSAAGGVGLRIELSRVPIQSGVQALAGVAGVDPMDLATAGGEDYELLAAVPQARLAEAAAAVATAGSRLTAIGDVVDEPGVEMRDPDGNLRKPGGFDHFRGKRERPA